MELDRVPPTLWCPSLSRQLQQLAEPGLGHRTCTAVVLTIAKHQVEGVDAPGIAEPARLVTTGTHVDHLDEAGIDIRGAVDGGTHQSVDPIGNGLGVSVLA